MAALLLQLNSCSRKVLSEVYTCYFGSKRYKSKAIIPAYRSTYGIKILDSSHVNQNQILVRQRTLESLPGLNVVISGNGDLLAKVSGKVYITYEKTNLNSENKLINLNFSYSLPKYKVYFNVIPDPVHQVFKLVDTIWLKYLKMTTNTPLHRTQGDGMEKVETFESVEHTIVLQPQENKELVDKNNFTLPKSVPLNNFDLAIQLTPHAVNKKKKNLFENIKNREPKFVPYEPYKAAVKPIVPYSTKTNNKQKVKKNSKEFAAIFRTKKLPEIETKDEKDSVKSEVKNENQGSDVDWQAKFKILELEMLTLKEENEQLENELKFQVQVNGELKNLLVAAVGEDMETKVHVLTEDKLHLAQALLASSESLSSHQEQTEWLAGQCEVWRSKFLASSVMVEELARWKASLCQKVNEANDALKKFLEEEKIIRENVAKTYDNLCILRDNFDLHNKKNKMFKWNIIDVCKENLKLSDILILELLGSKQSEIKKNVCLNHWDKTQAEKSAEKILSNPGLLQLIKEPDAACNAVVGAAVTLSGKLYLQTHPPKIECCPQCTGEIKLV